MGVRGEGDFGLRDEQAAGHAEVDEQLRGLAAWGGEVGDDGLADAVDAVDACAGECGDEVGFGGLEGLRLAAGPDAEDALAGDAGVDAVGDGFDFGEFGHGDKDTRYEIRDGRWEMGDVRGEVRGRGVRASGRRR